MSAQAQTLEPAAAAKKPLFPPGIPFIVGNEGAERFSYYGMRQILYVYLVSLFIGFIAEKNADPAILKDATVRATQITHLFFAGVYAFPMIGAILADRLLGKYRVILWVSMIYVAGHAALAVAGRFGSMGNLHLATLGVYLGLGLIAVGSGGIKPCVAANVGDQFTKENGSLVNQVFQIFYFIINFGSFFSTILTPLLLVKYGPEVAFLVPGILMAAATLVFWLGRGRFVKVPPRAPGVVGLLDVVCAAFFFVPFFLVGFAQDLIGGLVAQHEVVIDGVTKMVPDAGQVWTIIGVSSAVALAIGFALFAVRQAKRQDDGFLAMLIYALTHQGEKKPGAGFFGPVKEKFGEEAAEGSPAVLRIIAVFAFVSFFWGLWDQNSTTWVEQAKHMTLTFSMPTYLWSWFAIPATVAAAAFGAVWLFTWISNRPLPRQTSLAVMGLIVLWGVVAAVMQLVSGGQTELTMAPAQIGSINPLLVMIVIPVMNVLVYEPMERRGTPLKPLARMTIGMFMASLAFVAVAVIQIQLDGGAKLSVMWQSIPYFILTVSEVMVSITGLEFAYTQAPTKMKSTIQGFWLLSISMGDLLVVFLAPLEKGGWTRFFFIFAGLMAAAAAIFAVIAAFYKGKTYLQDAGAAAH